MTGFRVGLAGLFHETHSFVQPSTPLEAFDQKYGPELLDCLGDGSPIDGFLETAQQQEWEVWPLVDFRAMPSGTVEHQVFEVYWVTLRQMLLAAPQLDALFLVLHGAMLTDRELDVEGELLRRIRTLPQMKRLPIFGVFDLHANFSAAMARHATGLVAYRQNPHTDARQAAQRAAQLLARTLEQPYPGPRMHWRLTPLVWPPTGTGTADPPMATLTALARWIESQFPQAWAINVQAGFSYADTPTAGVSFSVLTPAPAAQAQQWLDWLAQTAVEMRHLAHPQLPTPQQVLASIAAHPTGPTLLVEPSDNIGGGAPGDGTGVLRAFLQADLHRAAVIINDPQAVQQLSNQPPGSRHTLAIGGKGSSLDRGPVVLEVELLRTGTGSFTLHNPHSHLASMMGTQIEMGPTAVIQHRGITLLLTSHKTPPFDLGQWYSQGIDPTKLAWIGVKAAVAHRAAYDPIAAASYTVETPGPCSSDLRSLPYRHLRRPVFPLDDI
jgi:microcystin degradation protein MlrC